MLQSAASARRFGAGTGSAQKRLLDAAVPVKIRFVLDDTSALAAAHPDIARYRHLGSMLLVMSYVVAPNRITLWCDNVDVRMSIQVSTPQSAANAFTPHSFGWAAAARRTISSNGNPTRKIKCTKQQRSHHHMHAQRYSIQSALQLRPNSPSSNRRARVPQVREAGDSAVARLKGECIERPCVGQQRRKYPRHLNSI